MIRYLNEIKRADGRDTQKQKSANAQGSARWIAKCCRHSAQSGIILAANFRLSPAPSFRQSGGMKSNALWGKFDDATAAVMADGARVFGMLWKSAWIAGGGPSIASSKLGTIAADKLKELYEDAELVPSFVLDEIEAVLK